MKTKTLYTCEVCNTDYAVRNKAEDCEQSHKKAVVIIDQKFLPYKLNGDYPMTLNIKFEDGKIIKYKR